MSEKVEALTAEELGNKLLNSVKEMKAGKAARTTQIAFDEVEKYKNVTLQLNKVYSNNQSTLSEDLAAMQHKSIGSKL